MESVLNGSTITIKLNGRIDSANAPEVQKEIFDLLEKDNAESVILDAKKLEYISSAGLRIILQLKKTKPDSRIINVSSEVYGIFDMTGFADIIETQKALREISIDGCEAIGEGEFGIVYRLDPDTIVKVYKKAGYDEIKRGMSLIKQAFVKGLPTAISFDIVQCGDKYGVVFELIKSDTLANRIRQEPERLDEYMEKYVELVRKLQMVAFDDVTLMKTSDAYRKRFRALNELLTAEEMSEIGRLIDSIPEKNTLVHGDLHARNVMIQDDELLFIDMDELMCGHPIYDICEVYFAYTYLQGSGMAEKLFGFDDEMCTRFLNSFTEVYFAGLSPEDRDRALKAVTSFGDFRRAYMQISYDLQEKAADTIKNSVLPHIDDIVDALDLIA